MIEQGYYGTGQVFSIPKGDKGDKGDRAAISIHLGSDPPFQAFAFGCK